MYEKYEYQIYAEISGNSNLEKKKSNKMFASS